MACLLAAFIIIFFIVYLYISEPAGTKGNLILKFVVLVKKEKGEKNKIKFVISWICEI